MERPGSPGALSFCDASFDQFGVSSAAGDFAGARAGSGGDGQLGCAGAGGASAVAPGFGFGSGAALGGAAAARVTGLGFGGAAGATRCGKRSGGGGRTPLRSGSAVITFGAPDPDGSEDSSSSGCIDLPRGGGAALLERGSGPGIAPGGRGAP